MGNKEFLSELIRNVYLNKARAEFFKHWCRERRAKLDWKAILSPCKEKIAWNSSKRKENATDPNMSFISLWDIRPVGEYSRFSIQSQTKEGNPKERGGDSWRVLLRGPSYISPTVIDHNNGSYEVLFLAMEAGVYTVNIILDFTLCEGFIDPPVDWFIIGEFLRKIPNINPGFIFVHKTFFCELIFVKAFFRGSLLFEGNLRSKTFLRLTKKRSSILQQNNT